MKLFLGKMLVLFTALLVLGACSQGLAVETGDTPPDFTLSDIAGNQVSLASFKGKVIILNFFASWCPPCRAEIPDFIELQKQYGPKGFTVVGVALVSPEDAKSFAEQAGINYPVLVDDNKVSNIYGPIRSIPTTFIIGKDFKVAKMYIGGRPKSAFEADVNELLK